MTSILQTATQGVLTSVALAVGAVVLTLTTSTPCEAECEPVASLTCDCADESVASTGGQVVNVPASLGDVFLWVCQNPMVDAEHVAGRFGMTYREADEMLEVLLNTGLLDFA